MKGIIMIATGHWLYGRSAYNLAMSIKAKDKNMPIALIANKETLAHLPNKHLFDNIIYTDKKWNELKLTVNSPL